MTNSDNPEPHPTITGPVKKQMPCHYCKHEVTAQLVSTIAANGVSHVYWYCLEERHRTEIPARNIPHDKLKEYYIDIDRLPVVSDNRGSGICSVWGCDNPAVENHHMAPRHIFGDEADKWPGAPLCKYHHELWHSLVTPDMPGANKKVGEEWKLNHTQVTK